MRAFSPGWPASVVRYLTALFQNGPAGPTHLTRERGAKANLVFLAGMLSTVGRAAKFIGRVGAELNVDTARKAAHLAALNALAVAREHLGTLDRPTRIVRLAIAGSHMWRHARSRESRDGASELLQDVFGREKSPCCLVYGSPAFRSAHPSSWIVQEATARFIAGPGYLVAASSHYPRGMTPDAGRILWRMDYKIPLDEVFHKLRLF